MPDDTNNQTPDSNATDDATPDDTTSTEDTSCGDQHKSLLDFTLEPLNQGGPLPTAEQAMQQLTAAYGKEGAATVVRISKEMVKTFTPDAVEDLNRSGVGNDAQLLAELYRLSQDEEVRKATDPAYATKDPQYRLRIGKGMESVAMDKLIGEMPAKIRKAIHEARTRFVARYGPQRRT